MGVCTCDLQSGRDAYCSVHGDQAQPLPVVNSHVQIQNLVMDDVQTRLEHGIAKYGTGLQPFNGRDMLRDAYEEALDLVVYLRGCLYERDGK